MIKEKILLYQDYSHINKSCFCCHQYTHIIEECPKLHFVPDIEKIIKQANFPKHNQRFHYVRRSKKSHKALLTLFDNLNKPIEKSEQQFKQIEPDELEVAAAEESNFEGIDGSEISEFNNEGQQPSKKEVSSFVSHVSHKNPTLLSNKRIDISKDDTSPPSIVISNNDIKESVIYTYAEPQQKTKTLIRTSSNNDSKSCKYSEGFTLNTENKLPEIKVNIEIDRVFNFNKYFPSFNIKQIIKNYQKSCIGKIYEEI